MARILVVDDAAFMRIELKGILESVGHVVVSEASNGTMAFAEYEKHQPDLVTMDVTMPGINGVEAVKNIISKYPKANIIMVSAITQKNIIVTALASGAKNYILKPYSPDKVIQAINQVLGTNYVYQGKTTTMNTAINDINRAMNSIKGNLNELEK